MFKMAAYPFLGKAIEWADQWAPKGEYFKPGYTAFFSICLSCFGLRIVFHYGPAYPMENASALPSPRFEMLSTCTVS